MSGLKKDAGSIPALLQLNIEDWKQYRLFRIQLAQVSRMPESVATPSSPTVTTECPPEPPPSTPSAISASTPIPIHCKIFLSHRPERVIERIQNEIRRSHQHGQEQGISIHLAEDVAESFPSVAAWVKAQSQVASGWTSFTIYSAVAAEKETEAPAATTARG